jgi:heme-degrading monooxygenase HmoA
MRTQLRRYRTQPGQAEQFAAEWRDGVAPLRRQFGFDVRGWLVEGSDEFVWIVEHDDAESFDAADQAYYESEARRRLEPEPSRLIADARKDWVTLVG